MVGMKVVGAEVVEGAKVSEGAKVLVGAGVSTIGVLPGSPVGDADMVAVGDGVGFVVGRKVGFLVGGLVGRLVGLSVGDGEGSADTVGAAVVGAAVGPVTVAVPFFVFFPNFADLVTGSPSEGGSGALLVDFSSLVAFNDFAALATTVVADFSDFA